MQQPPKTVSPQVPTDIGERTLKTRSMWWNRSGRPRSDTRSAGETASAAAPTYNAVLDSFSFPKSFAARLSTDDAPPIPPVKK